MRQQLWRGPSAATKIKGQFDPGDSFRLNSNIEAAIWSLAACKSQLPPRFENDDGGSVRQIEAAAFGPHRQPEASFGGQGTEHGLWQAASFGTEQERITRRVNWRIVASPTARAERIYARVAERFEALFERYMSPDLRKFAIVEARTSEPGGIEFETEWLDQMQCHARVRA